MVYLSDNKISNNSYQIPLKSNPNYQAKPLNITSNNKETDSVSFSTKDSNSKKKNANRTIAYIIGGLVIIGGIIFAVMKLKKGKPISTDKGKDIANGIEDLGKKASDNSKGTNKNSSYNSNSDQRSLDKAARSSSHPSSVYDPDKDPKVLEMKRNVEAVQQEHQKELEMAERRAEDLKAQIAAEEEKKRLEKLEIERLRKELEALKAGVVEPPSATPLSSSSHKPSRGYHITHYKDAL